MFNIALEHTYFDDGKFPGVSLTPTADSERRMLNNNLITRKRTDGITVFFDNAVSYTHLTLPTKA